MMGSHLNLAFSVLVEVFFFSKVELADTSLQRPLEEMNLFVLFAYPNISTAIPRRFR